MRQGSVPPPPGLCELRTLIAVPGWRSPVPTGLVVVRCRDAPLPWGSGIARVLSGFYPGSADTCSGTLSARYLGRRPVAHEHMVVSPLLGGNRARGRWPGNSAYEYMSAWIWHCYQAGYPPLVLAHAVNCGSLAGWTQHFYKVVVPPSSG